MVVGAHGVHDGDALFQRRSQSEITGQPDTEIAPQVFVAVDRSDYVLLHVSAARDCQSVIQQVGTTIGQRQSADLMLGEPRVR